MMGFGKLHIISIIPFFVMHFALLYSMKWRLFWGLLSKKRKPNAIRNINTVFMFMQNQTNATLLLLLNTSAVILAALFYATSTNDVLPFLVHLITIHLNVRIADMKWIFLNYTLITSVSPSKKCTRMLCPNLVESGLPLSFHFLRYMIQFSQRRIAQCQ